MINTVVHYYTVGHMTALTALNSCHQRLKPASSVKLPTCCSKVTLPVCLPAILDIATYLFVNALTTMVVFLYSTDTIPASVSILNMDDAGQTGAAAAMAVMIMIAAAIAKLVQMPLGKLLENRTQAWRKR